MKKRWSFRWSMAFLMIMAVGGLFILGIYRLQFSTDILAALPRHDQVLADARYVLMHNPSMNMIIIDIGIEREDVQRLIESGAFVETQLQQSGLFKQVGLGHMSKLMPEFLEYAVTCLPVLFSETELEAAVAPMLSAATVRTNLEANLSGLRGLEGIGQAELMARDPLNLRHLALARLATLIPVKHLKLIKGNLISNDSKHLLVIAEPVGKCTDTDFARKLECLMQTTAQNVAKRYGTADSCTLTPVGSYRTSLDNEVNAKRNVQRSTILSTAAVTLLLLGAFPRPLFGLIALLPACAGTMLAIFVYSLVNRSISLLAVGFGGAIISFTVDYGIAYLLFLDRCYETKGFEASREVWSIGLIAMLTTAVSFAAISMSGFPALSEIGLFSALGVLFTYIFVHAALPFVFVNLPAAEREPFLPMQTVVNRIALSHNSWKVVAALVFCFIMLLYARLDFQIDLTSLNAASPQTLADEKRVQNVWGDTSGSVQLMLEAGSKDELADKGDKLTLLLEREIESGALSPCLLPSDLLPGATACRDNFAAWQRFWSAERIADLESAVRAASIDLGFASDAFAPFFSLLVSPSMPQPFLSDQLCSMFGITATENHTVWRQVLTLSPGPAYIAEDFYGRISACSAARIFDQNLFSRRLGSVLMSGVLKMTILVGLITVLVTYFYFMDLKLTLLGIAPTVFALICTLGSLNIMRQTLGVPALMVSVVVIGMGTDYALYLIRAYQRYYDDGNTSLGLIRLSVFLSFATTFIGFGTLALCDNPMLKNAGMGLTLGIGYSFIGAFTIVPPLVRRLFVHTCYPNETVIAGSREHFERFIRRYRHLDAYLRLFARFKVRCDPMFPRLAAFLNAPSTIIDIGTGYAVPAAWILEMVPGSRLYGIEPDEARQRIAAHVIGGRGRIQLGRAPEIPIVHGHADAALMIDMLHYLTDDEARLTLTRLYEKLIPGATLVVRVMIPLRKRTPFRRFMETRRLKIFGIVTYYRSQQQVRSLISGAGFFITCEEPSSPGREKFWFIARR